MSKTEIVITIIALSAPVVCFISNPWLGVVALNIILFTFVIAMLKDWI